MTKARNLADNALTTVSPTELGYVDGVTSPIQTQLDAKLATTTAASTYLASATAATTYIPNTLTSTTGDLIYASAANTPARLAAGSSGQVLTANGAGVAPSYQTPSTAPLTLIASTTATSGVITFSNIPTHKSLRAVIYGTATAQQPPLGITFNGNTNNSYITLLLGYNSASPYILLQNPAGGALHTQPNTFWYVNRFLGNGAVFNAIVDFPSSGMSRTQKAMMGWSNYDGNAGVTTPTWSTGTHTLGTAAAITSLSFFAASGGGSGNSSTIDLYAYL